LKPLILSGAGVELAAADGAGKLPRIAIVAYNGGVMSVPGWGPIAIDLAALKINATTPILADHRTEVGSIIGHGAATTKGGKLLVDGVVSGTTETARQVVSMSAGGFQFQASVGVMPTAHRFVKPGEKVNVNGRVLSSDRGFELVTAGQLKEVTVTPLGADDATSVAIAASLRKGSNMPEDLNTGAAGAIETTLDENAIRASERARIREIDAICAGLDLPLRLRNGLDDMRQMAINGQLSLEALREHALNAIRDSRVLANVNAIRRDAPPGFESCGSKGEIIQAALLCRMGMERLAEKSLGADVTQRASDLRSTHLLDLCRAALQADGKSVPHGREDMVRAAFSTVSLPTALGEVARKVLLDAYNDAPATWRGFAAVRSVSDFRDTKALRPSFGGTLDQVAPAGELKHTTLSEFTATFRADTFGKVLSIDRRDFINDDAGVFSEAARAFGAMATRSVNDLIYGVILANAGSFFHASNGNLIEGADSALGVESLSNAIKAMRTQRDAHGNDLDIVPAVLVVPPALETVAKEALESEFIQRTFEEMADAKYPTGNAVRNAVKLLVEPRLSNTTKFSAASAKHWYLFAGPLASPVIAAFLNGQQAPTVEFFGLSQEVNRLGMGWRVYMDYGATLGDPKAAVRSKGEA